MSRRAKCRAEQALIAQRAKRNEALRHAIEVAGTGKVKESARPQSYGYSVNTNLIGTAALHLPCWLLNVGFSILAFHFLAVPGSLIVLLALLHLRS